MMQHLQGFLRRSRPSVMVLALVLLATACSTSVEIQSATASGDGFRLDLSLNSCNGTYTVAVEEDDVVNIKVTDGRSPIRLGGEDCADHWSLTLRAPLGARAVVDMATGSEVEVRYEPWNQQRFTEAEYRSALQATAACMVEADATATVDISESAEGPYLDVNLRDLGDGESGINPEYQCTIDHLDALRR